MPGHTGWALRDHAVCHEPCPTLGICNHSLNCKHRGSVRGCAPFSLHAVLVPAGHLASSLGSVASAGISSRPGAQAGSRYIFIPALHHWPWRVASALIQGCSWQITCGEKCWLEGHLHLRNALFFFPPPHYFLFLFWLFFYYFLNAVL